NNWTCCAKVQQYWEINGYKSADECVDKLKIDAKLPGNFVKGFKVGNLAGLALICRGWHCTGAYAPTVVAVAGRCWTTLFLCNETKYSCKGTDRLYSGTAYGAAEKPSGEFAQPTTWLCE